MSYDNLDKVNESGDEDSLQFETLTLTSFEGHQSEALDACIPHTCIENVVA